MIAAGAIFSVTTTMGEACWTYRYVVKAGGDVQRCREIFEAAKARPSPFFDAFKIAIICALGGPLDG